MNHILLAYGTRPQIIKASILRVALGERMAVTTMDTGQHYDFELNQLLYDQLGVSPPDFYLEVGSASHADQTAAILSKCASHLAELRPDAVVTIGDTNSTLGCALAAAKLRIPVVHVEAGLRARDSLMAEEVNRRVVDAIAGLLCAPSAAAEARLLQERPDAVVVRTGDVARDILMHHESHLVPARLPDGLPAGAPYLFVTVHRAELTSDRELLSGVLDALASMPIPAILALHPRTRAAMADQGLCADSSGSLHVISPVGYFESLALTQGARMVITDSGGVQREAYWLGTRCITLRSETEWTETIELGANHLLAPKEAANGLAPAVLELLDAASGTWCRDAYGEGDAAARIAEAVANAVGVR